MWPDRRPGATLHPLMLPVLQSSGCSPRGAGLLSSPARPQPGALYPLRGRPGPAHWRPLQLSPHPAPAQLPSPPSSALPSALPGDGLPIGHSQVRVLLGRSPLMLPPSLLPRSTPPSAWPLAGPPCCQAPTHLEPPPCPCLSPPPHLPGFPVALTIDCITALECFLFLVCFYAWRCQLYILGGNRHSCCWITLVSTRYVCIILQELHRLASGPVAWPSLLAAFIQDPLGRQGFILSFLPGCTASTLDSTGRQQLLGESAC